jgi:hypothetical protein
MQSLSAHLWRWRRNALCRRVDRVEAWVALLLLLLFLTMAPLTALATSSAVADAATRQRSGTHHVTAVLQRAAPDRAPAAGDGGHVSVQVPVRWTARDGVTHTGTSLVRAGQHAGTTTKVWVAHGSRVVQEPPSRGQTTVTAAITGADAVLGFGLLLLLLWVVIRSGFDAHRMVQWDREWAENGPRWSHGRR